MNDFGAVAVGLGIGFLIGLPAIVAFRHDIAHNVRSLWKSTKIEQNVAAQEERQGTDSDSSKAGGEDAKKLSPAIALFAMGAAFVSLLYGFVWGETMFAVTGVFGMLSVGLAFFGSRAQNNRI